MPKVKIDMRAVEKRLNKIKDDIKSDALKDDIGKESVRYIKGKTRSGTNLETGKKHAPLKDSSIRARQYLDDFNSTDNTYSPKRSNVTFSGQLVESMKFEKVARGVNILFPSDIRKPYKTANKSGKAYSNKKIYEYLVEQGRGFLGIDDTLKKNITSIIRRFLRRSLRK